VAGRPKIDGELTAAQIVFVSELTNGASQPAAYRKAYDTSGMKEKTITDAAFKLSKHPAVVAKIEAVVQGAARDARLKSGTTLADLVREADDAIEFARQMEQPGAVVSAATLKAKLLGHLVERKEVRSGHLEETDTAELLALREELKKAKETAASAKAEVEDLKDLVGAIPSPAVIKELEQQGNRPTSRVLQ